MLLGWVGLGWGKARGQARFQEYCRCCAFFFSFSLSFFMSYTQTIQASSSSKEHQYTLQQTDKKSSK